MDRVRQAIIDEAYTYIGTPYQHKGRIKGVGVDCGGMIYNLFSPYLPLPPFPASYASDWSLHKGDNEIYLDFIAPFVIEVPRPVPAGVTMVQFGRNFGHGIVCVGKNQFIHSYGRTQHGSVIKSGLNRFNKAGKLRPMKHYDVKPEYQEQWATQ